MEMLLELLGEDELNDVVQTELLLPELELTVDVDVILELEPEPLLETETYCACLLGFVHV